MGERLTNKVYADEIDPSFHQPQRERAGYAAIDLHAVEALNRHNGRACTAGESFVGGINIAGGEVPFHDIDAEPISQAHDGRAGDSAKHVALGRGKELAVRDEEEIRHMGLADIAAEVRKYAFVLWLTRRRGPVHRDNSLPTELSLFGGKASADHSVRAWRETYELPTLVTNCSNNYGPYQFPEKLIPHMIIRGLTGEYLPVYGDGQNIRDWLYVEDHARALTTVLQHGRVGETYNVGGRAERTNLDVTKAICDILDEIQPKHKGPRRTWIKFVNDRPGHDRRYAIDASKLECELGWRAAENFETGLRKTVE